MAEYLYVGTRLDGVAVFSSDALSATTERHRLTIDVDDLRSGVDPHRRKSRSTRTWQALVIALKAAFPPRAGLRLAAGVLRRGLRLWLYWPEERVVEVVDKERLRSLWRHWGGVIALERIAGPVHRLMTSWDRERAALRWIYRGTFPARPEDLMVKLHRWSLEATPVPFPALAGVPNSSRSVGAGLYLRTDFGRRLFPAAATATPARGQGAAAVTDRFLCLLTSPSRSSTTSASIRL